jgi:hypothetical protein
MSRSTLTDLFHATAENMELLFLSLTPVRVEGVWRARNSAGRLLALSIGAAACGGGGDELPDASSVDAAVTVTLSAVVTNLDGSPNPAATVSLVERPDISSPVDSSGSFTLQVPSMIPITLAITTPGRPAVFEQPVILYGDVIGIHFGQYTQSEYDYIESFATRPAGTGIFFITVLTMGECNLAGAHLDTVPASGTVVYMEPNQEPNGTYTSIQPNASGGYIIGVSGTTTPRISEVPAPCEQVAFPVTATTAITFLGPVAAQDGGLHVLNLFVR